MKSIYRNEQSKTAVWQLYDRQMTDLKIPYADLFVDTSFGKTHIIECGNLKGNPLCWSFMAAMRQLHII